MKNVSLRARAAAALVLALASVCAVVPRGAEAQQYPSLQGAVFNSDTPQGALGVCASHGFGSDWHLVAPELAQSLTDRRYAKAIPATTATSGWSQSDFYAYYRAHGGFGDTAFDCIPLAKKIGFHEDGTPPPPGIAAPTPTPLPTPGYPSSDLAAETKICHAAGQHVARIDPQWAVKVNSQMNDQVVPHDRLVAGANAAAPPNASQTTLLATQLVRTTSAALLNFATIQAVFPEGDPNFAGANGTYLCDGWAYSQVSTAYGMRFATYGNEATLLAQLQSYYQAFNPQWRAYQAALAAKAAATPAPVAAATAAPGWRSRPTWGNYRHDCVPSETMPPGWTKNCIDTAGLSIADDANKVYWIVAPSNIRRNADGTLTFFGRTVSRGTLVFENGYYFAVPVKSVSAAAVSSGRLGDVEKIVTPSRTFYVEKALVRNVSDGRGGISKTVFAVQSPGGELWRIDVSGTANVIAAGGANVIAAGGANVIAAGGANVIAAGGANVIAAGGANVLYAAGVIAAGGANVIAAGGAN